jgi:hypothetical protein
MASPGSLDPPPHVYNKPSWIAYADTLPPDTWSRTAIALGDGDKVVTGEEDSDTVGVIETEGVGVAV